MISMTWVVSSIKRLNSLQFFTRFYKNAEKETYGRFV